MRGSVQALRTICNPSRSSSVCSPPCLILAPWLASTAPGLRDPLGRRARAAKPPLPQPLSFLC